MKPALTISGAMSTPLARGKFFCSHVISGSRMKLPSVTAAASTSRCCSPCADAAGAISAVAASVAKAAVIMRKTLAIVLSVFVWVARRAVNAEARIPRPGRSPTRGCAFAPAPPVSSRTAL